MEAVRCSKCGTILEDGYVAAYLHGFNYILWTTEKRRWTIPARGARKILPQEKPIRHIPAVNCPTCRTITIHYDSLGDLKNL